MTDQVDLKFRLMEYHRGAMEVRRSILFKGFLALITFDLVLGKAAPELIKPSLGSCNIKLLFTLLIVVAWGCYYWFAFENEAQTVSDRDKYKPLERELWNLTREEDGKTLPPPRTGDWARWGWAARGPVVLSLTLTLTIIFYCWML